MRGYLTQIIFALGVLLVRPAMADLPYAKALPKLAGIECSFRAVATPPISATRVVISPLPGDTTWYWWNETGMPPVPVLAAFRNPLKGADPTTTVVSPDIGGVIAMLTYDVGGEAMLSKHISDTKGVGWSAQRGTCTETKEAE